MAVHGAHNGQAGRFRQGPAARALPRLSDRALPRRRRANHGTSNPAPPSRFRRPRLTKCLNSFGRILPIIRPIMPSERAMRAILAALSVAAILTGMTPAQAEKRIFIIANNADGYGIDRCLAERRSLRHRRRDRLLPIARSSIRRSRSARSTATTSRARSRPRTVQAAAARHATSSSPSSAIARAQASSS